VRYTLLSERIGDHLFWGIDLNKNDLIATVANDTGLGRREAAKAVDSVLTAIADALKSGDEVRLVGFGTFSVSERAASQGRNPRTGETIDISASRQPKFRAGKGLKDALN
jgi:DNA-binding protein HU-beta